MGGFHDGKYMYMVNISANLQRCASGVSQTPIEKAMEATFPIIHYPWLPTRGRENEMVVQFRVG
jgi:hypothetical protein